MDKGFKEAKRNYRVDPDNVEYERRYFSAYKRIFGNKIKLSDNLNIRRSQILENIKVKFGLSEEPFHQSKLCPNKEFIKEKIQEIELRTNCRVYEFQQEGAEYLVGGANRCLFDSMGLEKAKQTLLSLSNKGGTILVCPAGLRLGWHTELTRWRPDLQYYFPPARNNFRYPNVGEVVVVSWNSLPKPSKRIESITPFALIMDDIHLAKNKRSVRYRAVSFLSKFADRRIGLTAVPIPNMPEDLWTVLSLVYGCEILGPVKDFAKTFFVYEEGQRRPSKAHSETSFILKILSKRRTDREVISDLKPEPRFIKRECFVNPGANFNQGDFNQVRAALDLAKLPELLNFIEERESSGLPLVVFTPFRSTALILAQRTGWSSIMGGMTLVHKISVTESFNSGQLRYIVMTSAGATGFSLSWQGYIATLARTSPDLSNEINEQIIRRMGRGPLNIYDFHIDHPLDTEIWERSENEIV